MTDRQLEERVLRLEQELLRMRRSHAGLEIGAGLNRLGQDTEIHGDLTVTGAIHGSVPWAQVTGKPFESGTYTPAPVGLTNPVISVAAGEYRIIGDVCKVWGRLDITSWSGSSGGMFITLPINPAVDQRVIGVVNYYRNGGSTEEGVKAAYSRNNVLAIFNSAGSNYISWESSALVQLRFMVEYPISA